MTKKVVALVVKITPVPWGRVKRGQYGQAYVPSRTRKFEATLKLLLRAGYNRGPLAGPLHLSVCFFVPAPKKLRRVWPCVRPDLDNFVKAVKDGANGVLWSDDCQVCKLSAEKRYAITGEPRIEIKVEEL